MTLLPQDAEAPLGIFTKLSCMSQPDRLIIVKQSPTAQAVHDLTLRVHDLIMHESGPKFYPAIGPGA